MVPSIFMLVLVDRVDTAIRNHERNIAEALSIPMLMNECQAGASSDDVHALAIPVSPDVWPVHFGLAGLVRQLSDPCYQYERLK
jgi:hypothetical protein